MTDIPAASQVSSAAPTWSPLPPTTAPTEQSVGLSFNDAVRANALLEDLKLQWADHFHMRDQTWKGLVGTMTVFLGVVGLEAQSLSDAVMFPAYVGVVASAAFGILLTEHHRYRQRQKFQIITRLEEALQIRSVYGDILEKNEPRKGWYTGGFISVLHAAAGLIGLALIIARL